MKENIRITLIIIVSILLLLTIAYMIKGVFVKDTPTVKVVADLVREEIAQQEQQEQVIQQPQENEPILNSSGEIDYSRIENGIPDGYCYSNNEIKLCE